MCRMFAVSSQHEMDHGAAWRAFCLHSDGNGDGWGLYSVRAGGDFLLHETVPASQSALARDLGQGGHLVGRIVLAHLRLATVGDRSRLNTHPFSRDLRGRRFVFCHQGDVGGAASAGAFTQQWFETEGSTDSEAAFCTLLDAASAAEGDPQREAEAVVSCARRLSKFGQFNFLLTDGTFLYAYRNGEDPLYIAETDGGAMLRSTPPSQELPWRPLGEEEFVVVSDGSVVRSEQ